MDRQMPIARAIRETALPHLAAHTARLPAIAPAVARNPLPAPKPRAASADQPRRRPGGQAFHARTPLVQQPATRPVEPPASTPPTRAAGLLGGGQDAEDDAGDTDHADDILGLALRTALAHTCDGGGSNQADIAHEEAHTRRRGRPDIRRTGPRMRLQTRAIYEELSLEDGGWHVKTETPA